MYKLIDEDAKNRQVLIKQLSSFKIEEEIYEYDENISNDMNKLMAQLIENSKVLTQTREQYEEELTKLLEQMSGTADDKKLEQLKNEFKEKMAKKAFKEEDLKSKARAMKLDIEAKRKQTISNMKKTIETSTIALNNYVKELKTFIKKNISKYNNSYIENMSFLEEIEDIIGEYNSIKLNKEDYETSVNKIKDSIGVKYPGINDEEIKNIMVKTYEFVDSNIGFENEIEGCKKNLNKTLEEFKKIKKIYEEQQVDNNLSYLLEDIFKIGDQEVKNQKVGTQSRMPSLISSVCNEKDLLKQKKVTTCAAVEEQSEVIQELKYKIEQKDKQILEMQQQIQQIQQIMNALQTQSLFVLQQNTKDRSIGIDSQQNVGSNTNPLNDHGDLVENLSGAVSDINTKQAPSSIRQRIDFFNKKS